MSKYSLSKSERLKHKKDIEALFASGKGLYKFPFNLRYSIITSPGGPSPVKFSVSVPKRKIKSAADRNRIKRKVREYYRINKHLLIEAANTHNCLINIMFIYTNNDVKNCVQREHTIVRLMEMLIDAEFN